MYQLCHSLGGDDKGDSWLCAVFPLMCQSSFGGDQGGVHLQLRNYMLWADIWWFIRSVMSDSCDPMDCCPPASSVQGISQARILEWVAISFSRGSSRSRNQPRSPASQVNSLLTELWLTYYNQSRDWLLSHMNGREGLSIPSRAILQIEKWFWLIRMGFHGGLVGKESACNAGDLGSVPGLGRSLGEENGYAFQLEKEMATHSSILVWRLQSMGLQSVGHY